MGQVWPRKIGIVHVCIACIREDSGRQHRRQLSGGQGVAL